MPRPEPDPKALEALFAHAEKTALAAGCAVQLAVARDGELLGARSFGRARFADGHEGEASADTLFAVYSVTKAITSAATWILLQEGRLALGDPVARHVPEFGANGKEGVRVEHLLLHTAGFPRALFPTLAWPDPAARLAELASWHLDWEPGSRFVYHGSSSMWVLAELITRITGADYRAFIRERILEPLALHDCFLGLPASEDARYAEVVMVGDPPSGAAGAPSPVDAPVIDAASLAHVNDPAKRAIGSPAGGAFATATDIARFYQALLADLSGRGPGIWEASMLRSATTPRQVELIDPMTQKPALRGLGVVIAGEHERMWRGFAEACSARSFGHMGAGGQIAWADPESGLSFAFLTNGAERDAFRQGANGFRLSTLAAAVAPRR